MIYRKLIVLQEFNLQSNNTNYRMSINYGNPINQWVHGPRLKVAKKYNDYKDIGDVPVFNDKDLTYDELLDKQKGKSYCVKDAEIRKKVTAFAIFGREEILNLAHDSNNDEYKAALIDRYNEFIKNTKTVNDCKKLAEIAWNERSK